MDGAAIYRIMRQKSDSCYWKICLIAQEKCIPLVLNPIRGCLKPYLFVLLGLPSGTHQQQQLMELKFQIKVNSFSQMFLLFLIFLYLQNWNKISLCNKMSHGKWQEKILTWHNTNSSVAEARINLLSSVGSSSSILYSFCEAEVDCKGMTQQVQLISYLNF